MGRLTQRLNGEVWFDGKDGKMYNDSQGRYFGEAADKLAHYEDMEEQLMKSAEIDIDSMVGEFMHYYNLQKENRLIELPCAINTELYFVGEKTDGTYEVYSITLFTLDLCKSYEDKIGKGFYFTKKEAEAKLKELEGVVKCI